jgi:uncharacterized protein (DUF433 family)
MPGKRMPDLLGKLLGRGIYSAPDAARLTGIPAARLRRWLRGYPFTPRDAVAPSFSEKVIEGELPVIDDVLALSFLDLQEARCLEEFRKRGVGWKALRDYHAKARATLGTDHPFSTGQFKTVGRRIMRDFVTEHGDPILLDLAKDQATFREFLQPYLRGLEFLPDSRFPARWFPMAGTRRVVLDPKRAFGHPIVAKRGVQTSILFRAYKAEGSLDRVARWYEVDVRSVKDAVEYERALAA